MAHQYTCDACAFRVRSETDDELIEFVREHAQEQHDMNMSRQDIRDGWETVRTAADD